MDTSNQATATRPVPGRVQQFIEFIFYGNYFYGICAISIIFETSIQLHLDLGGALFYITTFIATVLFYNYPYARMHSGHGDNPRTMWYIRNHHFVVINQIIFTIALALCFLWLIINYYPQLEDLSPARWFLIMVFPVSGALYYGSNFLTRRHNLRQIGWTKPFVIGFVWAGMANVYPVLYDDLIHSQNTTFTVFNVMLFLKTFMFVSMLAIMFDIKDYVSDSRSELNTLIVKIGLRKTIFFVIIPLTLLGLLTFISYALVHQFSILKMVLIMIPFLLLIASARSFRKRRSLLYYLIVIDGLFIVKAFFGCIAMFV
jgi:1,4-dihydroxy-2-naphthoate octaprenyltransferase